MPSRPRTGFVILLAALAACAVIDADARVFRWRGMFRPDGPMNAASFGYVVYEARMEVDGRPVSASVVNASASPNELKAILDSAAAGGSIRYAATRAMGVGEVLNGPNRLKVVAVPTGESRSTVMLLADEPGKSFPALEQIDDVPRCQGMKVARVMRNEDTRSTLQTGTTPDHPDAVDAFYRAALARDGWTPLAPVRGSVEGGLLAGFSRGSDVCWILCRRSDSDGETRVTLLHKRGKPSGGMGDR